MSNSDFFLPDYSQALDPGIFQDPPPAPTLLKDPGQFEGLAPGTRFIAAEDPEKKVRTKPYRPKSIVDFESVPEGAPFIAQDDPEQKTRTKPKYEGISLTAQILYDMALTDKEREKILERSYPGRVKRDPTGEWYVEDEDGKFRKPGRGGQAGLGFAAASAAPVGLSVLGGLGAGALAVETGPGAFLAAGAGAFSGATLGQAFNDVVLQLAGVYDRSRWDEAANLAKAGMMGTAGMGVGRGIGLAIKSSTTGVSALGAALPRWAGGLVGANPEKLATASELARKGVAVPPSTWAEEAPHVHNIVEVFDPAFRTQEPLRQSATEHYERTAKGILTSPEIGADVKGSLVTPTEAVSTEKAGVAIRERALAASREADARLAAQIEAEQAAKRPQPGVVATEHEERVGALRAAAADARKQAEVLVNQGFEDIQRDVDAAMAATKAGHNSGDLWWSVGEKLRKLRQGIQERAKTMYGQADVLAGGHLPNIEGLPERAAEFLKQLPQGFEQKYPSIVQGLKDLAGEMGENGEWIRPPAQPTFGQLHNLRSVFRSNVNFHDLTPDLRDGTYKFFARRVDEILHDAHATPELRAAAAALDEADKFYGDAIRPLTDRNIQAVMNGLESGLPADPKVLFDTLVREGRSELTSKVREMVGPNLWAGVKAADVQAMLDNSRTLIPGQIDGRTFARQVLDRHRSNMLEAVHGREASAKLLKQAQDIEMLNGRLDISVRPGDTMTSILAKAHDVEAALKEAAKQDPLKLLNREMKDLERERAQRLAGARKERKAEPLGFLYEPSVGATEAVERILRSEDLILASAAKFGEQSPEFNMLRQIWAQRFLEKTLEPGTRLAKTSPEIQQLMFPGVTLNQMQTLAKEMEFLMGSKALRGDPGSGASMSAFAKVEHPWGTLGSRKSFGGTVLKGTLGSVPGSDLLARAALTKYYALVTKFATSPALLRWFEKGISGSPEQKQAVRAAISKVLQKSGAMGAGAGEAAYQYGAPE